MNICCPQSLISTIIYHQVLTFINAVMGGIVGKMF